MKEFRIDTNWTLCKQLVITAESEAEALEKVDKMSLEEIGRGEYLGDSFNAEIAEE